MTALNILGIFILSAPLLGFIIALIYTYGAKECLILFGAASVIVGVVSLGAYLATL